MSGRLSRKRKLETAAAASLDVSDDFSEDFVPCRLPKRSKSTSKSKNNESDSTEKHVTKIKEPYLTKSDRDSRKRQKLAVSGKLAKNKESKSTSAVEVVTIEDEPEETLATSPLSRSPELPKAAIPPRKSNRTRQKPSDVEGATSKYFGDSESASNKPSGLSKQARAWGGSRAKDDLQSSDDFSTKPEGSDARRDIAEDACGSTATASSSKDINNPMKNKSSVQSDFVAKPDVTDVSEELESCVNKDDELRTQSCLSKNVSSSKDANIESGVDNDEDEYLTQLEKTICSSDEKLCKSCKNIVLATNYMSHLSTCLAQFNFARPKNSEFIKTNSQKIIGNQGPSNVTKRRTRNKNIDATVDINDVHDIDNCLEKSNFKKISTSKTTSTIAQIFQPKTTVADAESSEVEDLCLTAEEKCEKYLGLMFSPSKVRAKRVEAPVVAEVVTDWSCQVRMKRPVAKKGRAPRAQRRESALAKCSVAERKRDVAGRLRRVLSSTAAGCWEGLAAGAVRRDYLKDVVSDSSPLWSLSRSTLRSPPHYRADGDVLGSVAPLPLALHRSVSQIPGRDTTQLVYYGSDGEDDCVLGPVEGDTTQAVLENLLGSQLNKSWSAFLMQDISIRGGSAFTQSTPVVQRVKSTTDACSEDNGSNKSVKLFENSSTEQFTGVDASGVSTCTSDLNSSNKLEPMSGCETSRPEALLKSSTVFEASSPVNSSAPGDSSFLAPFRVDKSNSSKVSLTASLTGFSNSSVLKEKSYVVEDKKDSSLEEHLGLFHSAKKSKKLRDNTLIGNGSTIRSTIVPPSPCKVEEAPTELLGAYLASKRYQQASSTSVAVEDRQMEANQILSTNGAPDKDAETLVSGSSKRSNVLIHKNELEDAPTEIFENHLYSRNGAKFMSNVNDGTDFTNISDKDSRKNEENVLLDRKREQSVEGYPEKKDKKSKINRKYKLLSQSKSTRDENLNRKPSPPNREDIPSRSSSEATKALETSLPSLNNDELGLSSLSFTQRTEAIPLTIPESDDSDDLNSRSVKGLSTRQLHRFNSLEEPYVAGGGPRASSGFLLERYFSSLTGAYDNLDDTPEAMENADETADILQAFNNTTSMINLNTDLSKGGSLKSEAVEDGSQTQLISDWAHLFRSKTGADLVIKTEDGEVLGHTLVLMVRCKALYRNITKHLAEDHSSHVNITNMLRLNYPARTVSSFIEFLYTATSSSFCRSQLQDLKKLSVDYECPGLLKLVHGLNVAVADKTKLITAAASRSFMSLEGLKARLPHERGNFPRVASKADCSYSSGKAIFNDKPSFHEDGKGLSQQKSSGNSLNLFEDMFDVCSRDDDTVALVPQNISPKKCDIKDSGAVESRVKSSTSQDELDESSTAANNSWAVQNSKRATNYFKVESTMVATSSDVAAPRGNSSNKSQHNHLAKPASILSTNTSECLKPALTEPHANRTLAPSKTELCFDLSRRNSGLMRTAVSMSVRSESPDLFGEDEPVEEVLKCDRNLESPFVLEDDYGMYAADVVGIGGSGSVPKSAVGVNGDLFEDDGVPPLSSTKKSRHLSGSSASEFSTPDLCGPETSTSFHTGVGLLSVSDPAKNISKARTGDQMSVGSGEQVVDITQSDSEYAESSESLPDVSVPAVESSSATSENRPQSVRSATRQECVSSHTSLVPESPSSNSSTEKLNTSDLSGNENNNSSKSSSKTSPKARVNLSNLYHKTTDCEITDVWDNFEDNDMAYHEPEEVFNASPVSAGHTNLLSSPIVDLTVNTNEVNKFTFKALEFRHMATDGSPILKTSNSEVYHGVSDNKNIQHFKRRSTSSRQPIMPGLNSTMLTNDELEGGMSSTCPDVSRICVPMEEKVGQSLVGGQLSDKTLMFLQQEMAKDWDSSEPPKKAASSPLGERRFVASPKSVASEDDVVFDVEAELNLSLRSRLLKKKNAAVLSLDADDDAANPCKPHAVGGHGETNKRKSTTPCKRSVKSMTNAPAGPSTFTFLTPTTSTTSKISRNLNSRTEASHKGQSTSPIISSRVSALRHEAPTTPHNLSSADSSVAITPKPDYDNMPSPDIKRALEGFGIRPLSKSKARALLNHIYERTHPVVESSPETGRKSPVGCKRSTQIGSGRNRNKHTARVSKKSSQMAVGASKSSSVAGPSSAVVDLSLSEDETETDCPEESYLEPLDDKTSGVDDQRAGLHARLHQLITADPALYRAVLLYRPLSFSHLRAIVAKEGIRCSQAALLHFLDTQCITFKMTTAPRTRKKPRGKK